MQNITIIKLGMQYLPSMLLKGIQKNCFNNKAPRTKYPKAEIGTALVFFNVRMAKLHALSTMSCVVDKSIPKRDMVAVRPSMRRRRVSMAFH